MWRQEKTPAGSDLIFEGLEKGIAPSPLFGVANIQNANIATSTGEIMASYARVNQAQQAITSGTLTASVGDGATLLDGPALLKAGAWIRVTASTISSVTAATNPTTFSADYLVVGGGGGGGGSSTAAGAGGGGGGAQVATGSSSLSVTSYAITVGDGGEGGNSLTGSTGEASVIATVATAYGGAGGGGSGSAGAAAVSGGSGGGGGQGQSGGAGATGGTTGGNGNTTTTNSGGGGGGASAGGDNGDASDGGEGGAGTASSLSGTSTTYGGGGGGGRDGGSGGLGGAGGGGNGNLSGDGGGSAGTANSGGGGGGAAGSNQIGGRGGSGIVIISYTTGAVVATGGTITYNGTKTIHTFKTSGAFTVLAIPTGGLYYVSFKNSSNKVKLSAFYDPTSATPLTHGTSGTATFDVVATPNSAIAKTYEKYTTATATEYRYYILDLNGRVWVYDTGVFDSTLAASGVGTTWALPDPNSYASLKMTGLSVLNGWLMTVSNSAIYAKPTVDLGRVFAPITNAVLNEPFPTHTNYAMTGNQGKMYYCDGNYIGELFPTTSLITSVANIQSYCKYTASSTTGTISMIVSGSLPYDPSAQNRIPVQFFTDQYGTLPTAVTVDTVYYLAYTPGTATFEAYTTETGTTTINLATGASGNQYFNTFYPLGSSMAINGASSTVQYSSQRLNLPANETAQCMVEVGNTVIIGGNGNVLYPWNQIDALPSDFIVLPESDTRVMVNVNNMAYVFAGNKGNIYISNGSVASLALKVPDYCAGVPGTPLTYIEPYFTWGDAAYLRGRVYFSILDQTSTKAGNCGGVWSFIPPQNIDPNQEVGMALRLENQNSYGDYDGVATIIIPAFKQNATSPQYWAAWQDSYSTGTSSFGIDFTNTVPVTTYVFETDFIASGTMLQKQTFQQLEYKMTTALASGDSVQIFYRLNATDAWTTCGSVIEETTNRISGYFEQAFQKTQWVQFRVVVTTNGTTTSSFGRAKQLMLR